MLKLNDNKSEFIMFGTKHQVKKMESASTTIVIGNTKVLLVNHIHNLGFLWVIS